MPLTNAPIGLGTLVKVDHDDDTNYTTVGGIQEATPPPREREMVDETELTSTLETTLAGIEKQSMFSFQQKMTNAAAAVAVVDTLFDSGARHNWQLVFSSSTPETWTFSGSVSGIKPTKVVKGQVVAREVTVHRQGAITKS